MTLNLKYFKMIILYFLKRIWKSGSLKRIWIDRDLNGNIMIKLSGKSVTQKSQELWMKYKRFVELTRMNNSMPLGPALLSIYRKENTKQTSNKSWPNWTRDLRYGYGYNIYIHT